MGGVIVTLLLLPPVRARVWLNVAQLTRILGAPAQATAAFTHALAANPDDQHLRWQAGAALLEAGDAQAAAMTLLPFADQPSRHPALSKLLLAAFLEGGQPDQAFRVYAQLEQPNIVSAPITAALVWQYLQRNGPPPPDVTQQLLNQMFLLNPAAPEYADFEQQFRSPDFWTTAWGQQIRATLLQAADLPTSQQVRPPAVSADSSRVATLLGVAPTTISLGDELVFNGGFEQHDVLDATPLGWPTSLWSAGAFLIRTDRSQRFEGDYALRIDGLRLMQVPGFEAARAGVWHAPIPVPRGTPYAVSFAYHTKQVAGRAALWLANDPHILQGYPGEIFLPSAEVGWKRATIVGWTPTDHDTTFIPLLRSWSEGSVWFDAVSIRPLRLQTPVPPRTMLIQVSDVAP